MKLSKIINIIELIIGFLSVYTTGMIYITEDVHVFFMISLDIGTAGMIICLIGIIKSENKLISVIGLILNMIPFLNFIYLYL